MHHLAARDNIAEPRNVDPKGNDAPICPKPLRLGSSLPPQFLGHPLPCSNHQSSQLNCEERSGILNIIAEKRMDGAELGRCGKCSCTLYEWCGSPPRRTDNPLVHDVHFLRTSNRMDAFTPYTSI